MSEMLGRVLVTGGAGYVGSVVVDQLLAQRYKVRVVDSLAHGSVPSLLTAWGEPEFEFVRGDVCDAETRRSALDGVDAVVHLAAVVGDPACGRQPELAQEVNVDATCALVEEAAAAGIGRFLFASTCSNYGKMEGEALATEKFELRPVSLYAETKVTAERAILAKSNGGIATCCLRFATVFGASPRMRFDLTVNEFTRDALDGGLVVYGEQFWRPYVHVRDAARAIVCALKAERPLIAGEVFNVGDTRENYRKLDLVELLRQRYPATKVEFVPREEDPRDYRVSFEKVRKRLGFAVRRSVGDGIDEVAALVRSGLVGDPYAAVYRN
jgi:nucleoside-diphosphate-sugar epimerase